MIGSEEWVVLCAPDGSAAGTAPKETVHHRDTADSPGVDTWPGRHTTTVDGPKSAASRREVPVEALQPGTVKILREEWMRQGRPASGLVVIDRAGEPVHPDAYGSRFRALCKEAGMPEVRLHSVRHCIATALHEAGEAPAAVARLLGHEVNTHLTFYVTSSDESARRAAERFGKVLAGDSHAV